MLRDAWFCSLLICFFWLAVNVPPLALRSVATCLLMPCCCFSSLAVSPGVSWPLLIPCAMRSCWFSRRWPTLFLLLVDLRFFRRGQFSAVGGAVRAGFLVDGRFLLFEVGGFTRSQLAALHAIGDAVLLVLFSLRDAGIRLLLGFLCRCCR